MRKKKRMLVPTKKKKKNVHRSFKKRHEEWYIGYTLSEYIYTSL